MINLADFYEAIVCWFPIKFNDQFTNSIVLGGIPLFPSEQRTINVSRQYK